LVEGLKRACQQILERKIQKASAQDDFIQNTDQIKKNPNVQKTGRLKVGTLKFKSPTSFKIIKPSTLEILEMGGITIGVGHKPSNIEFPEKLCTFLDAPGGDSAVVKKEFSRVKNSLFKSHEETKNAKTLKITPEIYQQLIKQPTVFDNEIASRILRAAKQEKQILSLANRYPLETTESLIHAMNLLGKKKRELTIDDLIILFMQKDGAG
jgi:hypothetical protein